MSKSRLDCQTRCMFDPAHIISGKVRIEHLEVNCIIGVEERERENPQPVLIDIELIADLCRASCTDDIEYAPDYNALCVRIVAEMSDTSYALLEAFAGRVADICLESHIRVSTAKVAVKKPDVLKAFGDAVATVEITKER